jgi:hypothetical protein
LEIFAYGVVQSNPGYVIVFLLLFGLAEPELIVADKDALTIPVLIRSTIFQR